MEILLYVFAASAYTAAFVTIISFWNTEKPQAKYALAAILAGILSQLAAISCRWSDGISFELADIFAVIAVLVVLVLCVSVRGKQTSASGLIALPVAWLSVIGLVYMPAVVTQNISTELAAHVLLSICGYALLTVAALQAITLWYKQKLLKEHQLSKASNWLAPLDVIEQGLVHSVIAAAILIGLALISGVMFISDWQSAGVIHKTALAALSWLLLVLLLIGRWRFGWRGATAAKAVLSAYGLLLLAYFGSKLALMMLQR